MICKPLEAKTKKILSASLKKHFHLSTALIIIGHPTMILKCLIQNHKMIHKQAHIIGMPPHIRHLLKPSTEVLNLLKKIRSATAVDGEKEANLNHFYIRGFLWYETNRDITVGEEIIVDCRLKTPYEHQLEHQHQQHSDNPLNGEAHTGGSSNHSINDKSERGDNVIVLHCIFRLPLRLTFNLHRYSQFRHIHNAVTDYRYD
uniref:Uncharacterized protein n=1 Tax=Glossina pallidipes TaxID=7398 RepID=A0A1A9ZN97_GLOPL